MVSFPKDGDHGDDDLDEDGPQEADLEGRVEKYIGVKVKVCIFLHEHHFLQTNKSKTARTNNNIDKQIDKLNR